MSGDDEAGMAWWNSLTERERAKWSAMSGNTGRAIDAWEAFKRASMTGVAGAPRELPPQEVLADLLGSGDFQAAGARGRGAVAGGGVGMMPRHVDVAAFIVILCRRTGLCDYSAAEMRELMTRSMSHG
jgi:hypothetical protein